MPPRSAQPARRGGPHKVPDAGERTDVRIVGAFAGACNAVCAGERRGAR